MLIGLLAAALAVALGSLLKRQTGGGEPLMAVFPIVLITCLRWGNLAGWMALIGGAGGAWYVYLGEQFSFVVSAAEARSVVTALGVGILILAVCARLRASHARVQAANQSLSEALAEGERAHAALVLSEAQFRTSFERAAVGKVQFDPLTGLILRVNQAFADMLGHHPEALAGRPVWEFTIEDDEDAERADFGLVVEGKKPAYIRDKRYLHRDGHTIWGRGSATVTRSPTTGAPVFAVAVIENIDAQHKSNAALVAAKAELETLLEERTLTLAHRDVLLREVYHRVKNNLQIVDSLLVMERKRLADPDARTALHALRGRVHALGLVHHQLMGSNDLRTFDIAPFLEELSRNLLDAAASPGVSLTVRAEPLKVGLDFAIPLGLVVTELVTNALKHAFPTGIGVIKVALDQAPDGRVSLVVSDNGTEAEEAVPTSGAAKPLGMTIVDALVRQLGGVMTARRDAGGFAREIQIAQPVLQ
ncbi:histidine kinase dimerization/phosphoacceptor domain -containing protein [uncultured Phenylobacterium sp.]|uniref:sensor histidine kinase n=1 Tax=uncultured Phenylobacterium sp. TaxID=349273 RepID=UPI0025F1BDEC|nr:histidine kinase dimerization/phosphoacceptor domain -containing protein [uncultured Phenylobacterium sp.]